MWPFKDKTLSAQAPDIKEQLGFALKNYTAPQLVPSWKLSLQSQRDWSVTTAITEGYNASAIVYACVEKRAKLIASVPWVAKKKVGDNYEEQPDSPLQRLINSPNPDQSWYEVIYNASQSLDLAGHAFISELKAGSQNLPQELWYLSPEKMKIKPGSTALIDFFEYDKRKIKRNNMIMLKMPNPSNPWFGMPVLMAAGRATDVDREAGIWQKVSLQNRGSADIIVTVPEGVTEEQVKAFKDQYKANQQGPQNARSPIVTSATVQQTGLTAVELDFVASRNAVWTEICAVFGMSLANLGMTADVNLANAKAMDKALWQNTIIPQLRLMQHQLTHQLASEYGSEWILEPDLSGVEALQEAESDKITRAQALFAMGVPMNVIIQKVGLGIDPIEGGDVGYIPSGLIPTTLDFMDAASGANTNGQ